MRPTAARTALLRDALESAASALHRRRASDIPDGYIEDFVQLDWLEWHGGSLRLTTTGNNVRQQTASAAPEAAGDDALAAAAA
ncbi:MAG: hypothetical protein ACTHL8_22955 [Burkholderiaceae bacterium]